MYRYSVDNAVTYTSEDFVLFRESPFACWMERLSLESPDHGIPPDVGSRPPVNTMERQDDIAETLRAEEREVALIGWDDEEPARRAATLDAMRSGVDFVVNGQLALGPLSGSANLLMRTSGYSEFGNYLYIPCDTQARTSMHSGFRLCFLADLLHSLQGQLPPQMLIIRSGADVMPLQSEDTIHHYRAVKQRFMETMRTFRKHRMPDPAESSHFGRWSDCANEVLKQRALRDEDTEANLSDSGEQDFEIPLRKVAGATASLDADFSAMAPPESTGTLAEQARQITPGTYQVDPREVRGVSARTTFRRGRERHATRKVAAGPAAPMESSLAPTRMAPAKPTTAQVPPRRDIQSESLGSVNSPGAAVYAQADAALENLEFIGSRHDAPASGSASWLQLDQQAYEVEMPRSGFDVPPVETSVNACSAAETLQADDDSPVAPAEETLSPAGTPATRASDDTASGIWKVAPESVTEQQAVVPEPEIPPPNLGVVFNPAPLREQVVVATPKPHPLDSAGFIISDASLVDMDDASIMPRSPLEDAAPADSGFQPVYDMAVELTDTLAEECLPFGRATEATDKPEVVPPRPFNDSLITNGDF
jgi:hypothetical protein